jgi:glycosyltransferase involved in cell wall biosynthesis
MSSPASSPSLYDRFCQSSADGSLPPHFHVPLQQYALSGVETDRILTEAEQELWRRGVLLGYFLQKRSDCFFSDPFIPSFISPQLIDWLNETVTEKKGDLPLTRFMALLHKHLNPYDRLYDLKKERSVKRFYRDLVLSIHMARGFPTPLLPQAAFDGLAGDAAGLPAPAGPSYPLSKGLAFVWRYLLPRVPFDPSNVLYRADFLLQFFRMFAAVHLDPRLVPEKLVAHLNTIRYPSQKAGVGITHFMLEVFRVAGVQEDQRFTDPAFVTSMAEQFFSQVYPTLFMPQSVGAAHDAIATAIGIAVKRPVLEQYMNEVGPRNYIWKRPKFLPVNSAVADVNIIPCDDQGGIYEPLAQRLHEMAKEGLVRHHVLLSSAELTRNKKESASFIDEKAVAPVNLFACPVDRVTDFILRRGFDNFEGRYNIGYCSWGTDRLPQTYKAALHLFDEIWVPTQFQKKLFETEAKCPVRVVPAPMKRVAPANYLTREALDIPEDVFLFVTSFDCFDWISRKNPIAVVKAFQEAFKGNDKVALAIKTRNIMKTNSLKEEGHLNRLGKLWESDNRIHVFHDDFTDPEMSAFLGLADAYVSLPRASSLGATLIEAMAKAVPVAAPAHGGLEDYISDKTAFTVDTIPCSVVFDAYHFLDKETGHGWVDPEIASAANAMRQLFEKPELATTKAKEGQRAVEAAYSAEACGARMKARISEILASGILNHAEKAA